MRVSFLTCQSWGTKRQTGFHHLARAAERRGFDVGFFTTDTDVLDLIRGDFRFEKPLDDYSSVTAAKILRCVRVYSTRVAALDRITAPLYRKWGNRRLPRGIHNFVSTSELVIFESSLALLYFRQVKRIAPRAKCIYRVSDDLSNVPIHPCVIDCERACSRDMDLISTPCVSIYRKFEEFENARLHFHGIDSRAFDSAATSPYPACTKNAIFVGNCNADLPFFERAAMDCPEIQFHVIGNLRLNNDLANLHIYGERAFDSTIPYIKFADIGLNPLLSSGFERSLKVLQYTYCKLPIVTSLQNSCDLSHKFYYDSSNPCSIRPAIESALRFPRQNIDNSWVSDWDGLLTEILSG